MAKQPLESEVRVSRNYIRSGDPIKVKLAGKTQFRSGFTFRGWDPEEQMAVVTTPQGGWRYVALDGIKRVAVTKKGERKQ